MAEPMLDAPHAEREDYTTRPCFKRPAIKKGQRGSGQTTRPSLPRRASKKRPQRSQIFCNVQGPEVIITPPCRPERASKLLCRQAKTATTPRCSAFRRQFGAIHRRPLLKEKTMDESKICVDCQEAMSPIVIMDQNRYGSLEYRQADDERRWIGTYPTAGRVEAFMCGSCGRITLYGGAPHA
jgi:hypothetical protein